MLHAANAGAGSACIQLGLLIYVLLLCITKDAYAHLCLQRGFKLPSRCLWWLCLSTQLCSCLIVG